MFSAYLSDQAFSAVALFAGHDDQHHSQSGSAHQDDDPHGGVALVAGLDAGLGGLVAGIGCAAVGALAILVVMAGGLDDFALGDGFTAGLADLIAGVAVLGCCTERTNNFTPYRTPGARFPSEL